MTKEQRELEAKKAEVRALLADGKTDEAEAKMVEVRAMQKNIQLQDELNGAENRGGRPVTNNAPEAGEAEYRDAFWAVLTGKCTPEQRALVSSSDPDGGLIIPKDFQTKINELKRQYKSMKQYVGFYPTSTKSGQLVFEDLSTLTELEDLTEVTDITETANPKFRSVPYVVKDMGGLLPISNTLLQDEAANLMQYIGKWFAKKAIRTENKKIFAKLAEGVTKKALADWKELKASLNVDLDPIISEMACVCTNQDGFNVLDSALDGFGRPVLQPDPTSPTVKRFAGRVVHVFSNAELPTVGGKAPVIYGAVEEAITFVDRQVYELKASSEAGFKKNTTYVRCIERFDVVKADTDAYVYGELTIPV